MCFQLGSMMRIVRLGLAFLWAFSMKIACSGASASLSGWDSGSNIDVPVHSVSVSGSEENIAFGGSSN